MAPRSSPWKIRAIDLVELTNNHIECDRTTDWHERCQSWIAYDSAQKHHLVVTSTTELPSKQELKQVLSYTRNVLSGSQDGIITNSIQYYIVVEDDDSETTITVEDDSQINQSNIPSNPNNTVFHVRGEHSYLNELLIREMRSYVKSLVSTFDKNPMPFSTFPLSKVFVEPRYRKWGSESPESKQNALEFILDWIRNGQTTWLNILGEFGYGKTSLAQKIAYDIVYNNKCTRLPIIISLRGVDPEGLNASKLLAMWASTKGIGNLKVLERALEAGRLLVILDGFDEMKVMPEKTRLEGQFRALWSFSHKNARTILTGRENYMLITEDRIANLRVSKPHALNRESDTIFLVDLGRHGVESALRNFECQKEILIQYDKNKTFSELISRPSMLVAVAEIWPKLREKASATNQLFNNGVIYEEFFDHAFQRQTNKLREQNEKDQKEYISDANFMETSELERRYFTKGIAGHMASHLKGQNRIDNEALDDVVESLIKGIPNSLYECPELREDEQFSTPLEERLKASSDSEKIVIVKRDVVAYGVLVAENTDDILQANEFRFTHKSFLEFQAASLAADLYFLPQHDLSCQGVASKGIRSAISLSVPTDLEFDDEVKRYIVEILANRLSACLDQSLTEIERGARIWRWLLDGRYASGTTI